MAPLLDVQGLCKAYPGLSVLRNLSLAVAPGEVVAVRGASGTGKSTLLHCLGLIDRADQGSLRLDGQELIGLDSVGRARVRATRIGFVFQAFHLLPDFDVLGNILLSGRIAGLPPGMARTRALSLLSTVGLGDRAQAQVNVLSGGERQRVALCRALLTTPRLLLADEPTGSLDPATATIVLDQILSLARQDGAAVVLVTHDDAIAAQADRRLVLAGGCLTAVT